MKKYWYFIKHKIFPSIVAILSKQLIKILVKTCTLRVNNLEAYLQAARKEKCIVMLWHNRLVLAPTILYTFAKEFSYGVLVSKSRDGEIIASIVNSYKIANCIRVAHDAKKNALDDALAFINQKKGVLVVTPDGPKGPIYRIKKGTVYLAKTAEAKIIPMTWTATKTWQLNSWDKLKIPKPFSTIDIFFGSPLLLNHQSTLSSCDEKTLIEQSLNFN